LIRRLVVVAALIEREGLLLIGQRKHGDRHAFKWEFPGGKVEPGESPREALTRELKEELQIDAQVAEEVVRYEYRYPARSPILLIFHRVSRFLGEPQNAEFEQIRWEQPVNLPSYDFLDGDRDFVWRLSRGEFLL
jgi:8-oxo-dGTP diphosphatase